jgi:hypothetical protein
MKLCGTVSKTRAAALNMRSAPVMVFHCRSLGIVCADLFEVTRAQRERGKEIGESVDQNTVPLERLWI